MEPEIEIGKPSTHNTKQGLKLHVGKTVKHYCFKKIEADGLVDPDDLKPPDSHISNRLYQLLQAKKTAGESAK